MKRIVLLLAGLAVLWPVAAQAQQQVSGNLSTVAAACGTPPVSGSTGYLFLPVGTNNGSATFNLGGTWSGTMSFFGSADGAATWKAIGVLPSTGTGTAVTTATANGAWQFNPGAYTHVCIAFTTATSGTAVTTINLGQASARAGGGGSGTQSLSCGTGTILSLYEPYLQGTNSATTLTDFGPGANTGTFGASTLAPTWLSSGAGIVFNGSNYISIPAAAVNNAATVQMWFAFTSPQAQDAAGIIVAFSNSNGQYLGTNPSWVGNMGTQSGGGVKNQPINRAWGNEGVAFTFPAATTGNGWVNGQRAPGYIENNALHTWTGSGGGIIGGNDTSASFGTSMIFYGALVCNNVLTDAQIATNDYAFKSAIGQATGVAFPQNPPPNFFLWDGDSRWENAANNKMLTSMPYLDMKGAVTDTYNNISLPGQQMNDLVNNLATKEYTLADGFTGGTRNFLTENGINDISSGRSGATILGLYSTWCTNLHTRYPGSKCIVSTVVPDSGISAGQEGVRSALNTSIITNWRAGTYDGVMDEASDPLASTQVVPNGYNPSGMSSFNATYFIDGVHWLDPVALSMTGRDQCSLLAAIGQMIQPCWIPVTFNAAAIAAAGLSATSISMPLVNLGTGWRVCGVTSHVTTGFTGITTPTYEVGDSATSLTGYIANTAMSATGNGTPYTSLSNATASLVEATFGAANALSNAATGSITINVCVTTAP